MNRLDDQSAIAFSSSIEDESIDYVSNASLEVSRIALMKLSAQLGHDTRCPCSIAASDDATRIPKAVNYPRMNLREPQHESLEP